MARGPRRTGLIVAGILVLAIVVLVAVWDWNWFRPLVETRASAALGRPVSIGRLHVALGRTTQVTLDDVAVDNPKGFNAETGDGSGKFATISHLTVRIGLLDYLLHRKLVLPLIDLEQPIVDARQLPSGVSNWATGQPAKSGGDTALPEIGDLRIVGGKARVRVPKLKADFNLDVATSESGGVGAADNVLVVAANGLYAAQKITGRFVGGALLTLRDASTPYPVNLQLANGGTKVSLVGTVQNPLAFAGANLKLRLTGQDMAALYPLTGIAIPQTPPYRLAGNLDYANHRVRLHQFDGVVGSSDLSGDIDVDPRPGGPRPLLIADLHSRSVDLNDLAGFIGGTPGDKATPNQTVAQKSKLAAVNASPRLLPDAPINLPRLKAADVALRYRGAHIQGRNVPFDNIVVALDIVDGNIALHPLDFAVGSGTLASTISLRNEGSVLYTKAKIDFRDIDLGRIMKSTRAFGGAGTLGGGAQIDTAGNSLSAMLGHGNGGLQLNLASAGNLSALLVDLSGLQFGDSILSALGVPNRAEIRCLRSEFVLTDGVLSTKVFALDTTEAVTRGTGTIDFRSEKIDYKIQTRPTHFTVGSLHAPIDIGGTLKHPSILPDIPAVATRGAAVAGLAVLFPPLALLPTIQLGVGQHTDCNRLAQGGLF